MPRGRKPGTYTHSDETREKIQATQLINRLQKNALHEKGFMTKDQIRSAEILLKKVLPDLKAIEVSGGSQPIQVNIRKFVLADDDEK